MRKNCLMAFLFFSSLGHASIPIKDNGDISLTLAQNNYNRIVVKNDKIMEAVFPPNSMAIKRDEQDGSVYVMVSDTNPFTLFLSTEKGLHFSVTLKGEEMLGKTIELVSLQPIKTATQSTKILPKTIREDVVPEAILAMLTHMEEKKPFTDVKVKRQFGKVERWSKGLSLLPKESWEGRHLKGEILELYNGGKVPLDLSETWFSAPGTLAIKLSKPSLAPREHALVYRVSSHG